jgi:two-component system sensor histidine kinase/response regulator
MDIRMPNMDGYQATRAIRKLEREDAGTVPIVAMTANAFAEDIEEARQAGMDGYLTKPINPETLYETLAAQLGNK